MAIVRRFTDSHLFVDSLTRHLASSRRSGKLPSTLRSHHQAAAPVTSVFVVGRPERRACLRRAAPPVVRWFHGLHSVRIHGVLCGLLASQAPPRRTVNTVEHVPARVVREEISNHLASVDTVTKASPTLHRLVSTVPAA